MEDPIMKEILETSPEIAEADKRYQEFIADEQLRSRIDARDKFIRTNAQLMHEAEEKGLKQGIEQGIEQGREETLRATARKMKERKFSEDEIRAITGLSIEDVRGL